MTSSLKDHVQKLLEEHRGERVFRFKYLGKHYWLKQPEQLKGIWLLLNHIQNNILKKSVKYYSI